MARSKFRPHGLLHALSTEETLAVTAHKLRSPLGHIKGLVTSLLCKDVAWDSTTRSDFLAEIELAADRLAELVDELLVPRSVAARGLTARARNGHRKSRGA